MISGTCHFALLLASSERTWTDPERHGGGVVGGYMEGKDSNAPVILSGATLSHR